MAELADEGQRGQWSFGPVVGAAWTPWGGDGLAQARVIAEADGYTMVEVRARVGYVGGAHEHTHTEFAYVVSGVVRSNGVVLSAGHGAVAGAGSTHDSFEVLEDATYITIFKF